MANSISAFYQTVVGAASEATRLLRPTWNISDSIYWDHKPDQVGTLGQTLNVAIPADPTTSVQDIGTGDVQLSDISFSTTPIVFNKHPEFGFPVRDFEQFNSPVEIRNLFVDAALTGIKNNMNANVAALFTTGNFTTNTAISTTGHVITVPQFLSGLAILADQKVPVQTDVENMALVLPSTPYATMMDGTTGGSDAAWSQAFIVGQKTASDIHDKGQIPVAFSTQFKLDQQMPTTGAAPSRTFTGAYFHRFAVSGVSRALPKPDSKVVDFTYIDWHGLSIRIQLGYNQWPKGGYIVTIDCGYGLKVTREYMGQLFTIAE